MDLRLRSEFNLTLDDYMREVWLNRGKIMKPYTIPDLQADLAKVTKNPKFAAEFFTKYVYGIDKNNYEALLAKAGMVLRVAEPGKGWAGPIPGANGRNRAGQARAATGDGLLIPLSTVMGTPIYKAGLDAGDIIVKADGKEIKDAAGFNEVFTGKKPGDKVVVNYKNRTGDHETTIVLEENPAFEIVTNEKAGKELTKDQEAFRSAWLSTKVK